MADEPTAQPDDVSERVTFPNTSAGEERPGVMSGLGGAENRVVFPVRSSPSFATTGEHLAPACEQAFPGIEIPGFRPLVDKAVLAADPDMIAPEESSLRPPRFQPLLWLLTALVLLAILWPFRAGAEIPVPGRNVPFPNAPYAWRYEGPDFNSRIGNEHVAARLRAEGTDLDRLTPRIVVRRNEDDEVVGRYALEGGSFCDYEDDNCELDGFFPIVLASAPKEPVLAAITRVGVHGQRLSVFRPLTDREKPVFEVVADYAVILRMMPDGLMVELEIEGKDGQITREHKMWITGDAGACRKQEYERLPDPSAPSREAAALENDLRRIARDRSIYEFLALMSEEVLVSADGKRGKQAFLSMLDRGHETNGEAEFWTTLDRLLAAGGWNEGARPQFMTWPWFFKAWPEADEGRDAFIAGPDILLRAGPDENAPVLAKLPFGVLRWAAPDGDKDGVNWRVFGWLPVATADHCLGYVRTDDAAPVLGTRMIARYYDRRWTIEAYFSED